MTTDMGAATGAVDDLDCDIFDFDVIQAMDDLDNLDRNIIQALDFDLSSSADVEFHGSTAACGYSAIFSDADIVSHCRHDCQDDGDGDVDDSGAGAVCRWLLAGLVAGVDGAEEVEAGSLSPADSGVTDDGSLAPASGHGDAAQAMSAYVDEVERFLLDDDDDDDAPCGEQAEDLLGVVEDYFAGDQLLGANAEVVVSAAGRAEPTADTDGEEEENNNVVAAREDENSVSRKRARYE